jgi:hypothetical protein
MKASEIEPTTFRLVAQSLKQLRHRVPHAKDTGRPCGEKLLQVDKLF